MALYKMKEYYPDYRELFGDQDILSYDLYSGNDKVGSVDDMLVDEAGKFRYFIINTGVWVFGKKVLLPIGQARIDYSNSRLYADNLTREQVENLPSLDDAKLDYDHEEQVRNVYRPTSTRSAAVNTGTAVDNSTSLDASAPLNTSASLNSNAPLNTSTGSYDQDLDRNTVVGRDYDRDSYRYDYDPALYGINDRDHQNLRLYEERLIANKTRQKTGEVTVGKRIETEEAHVSVPVERERVVIERTTPMDAGSTVVDETAAFREGEVARVEVYEETPDIRKEAFVREEVNVRKEVDQDTVEANDTIRRERLDVNKSGNPVVRDDV